MYAIFPYMAYDSGQVIQLGLGQLTPEEVTAGIEALTGLSSLIQRDWINALGWGSSQSPIIVHNAIRVWSWWQSIKDLPDSSKIVTKWRSDSTPQDIKAVEFELYVAATIRARCIPVLFPIVNKRELDLAFDVSGRKVLLEASVRAKSDAMRRTDAFLNRVAMQVRAIRPGRHNFLGIRRTIVNVYEAKLEQWLSTCNNSDAASLDDWALFRSYPIDDFPEKHEDAKNFVGKPSVFCTSVELKGVKTAQGTVNMLINDPYALRKLGDEAKQLPKGYPGVIVLDISGVFLQLEDWQNVITKELSAGRRFTRVSAVVLIQMMNQAHSGLKVEKATVIINTRAKVPLNQFEEQVVSGLAAQE